MNEPFYTDHKKISMAEYSVARHNRPDRLDAHGRAYGLWVKGVGDELGGSDFLSAEEALILRDYLTEHFDRPAEEVKTLEDLPDNTVIKDSMGDVGVVFNGRVWYPETQPLNTEFAAGRYGPFKVLTRGGGA